MKFAVLSSDAPAKITEGLKSYGYTVLSLPPFSRLDMPVDTHADMLFFSHEKTVITNREYYITAREIFDTLCRECAVKLCLCDSKTEGKYPHDIAYNAIVINNTLYSKSKHTSPLVLSYAKKSGLDIISTAQGYAACSTLSLGSHVICADPSLCTEYKKRGLNLTEITNGDIKLPPFDCGFIGGCSGVDGKTVFFCGDIKRHRDADLIKKAIADCGMYYVSLSEGDLIDIGGIKFF